jgi:uncharacterized lipoprotein NlpE involved in copper resistance
VRRGLPVAELALVFGFLSAREIGRAACVSGKWHRAAESGHLWAGLGERRWERALQSTLGFEAAPTAALGFGRPKKSSR